MSFSTRESVLPLTPAEASREICPSFSCLVVSTSWSNSCSSAFLFSTSRKNCSSSSSGRCESSSTTDGRFLAFLDEGLYKLPVSTSSKILSMSSSFAKLFTLDSFFEELDILWLTVFAWFTVEGSNILFLASLKWSFVLFCTEPNKKLVLMSLQELQVLTTSMLRVTAVYVYLLL